MTSKSASPQQKSKIAVVIPTYKAKPHILGVIERVGQEVQRIYVVDDCCPDSTGEFVALHCRDERVRIVKNEVNRGVGGAVMAGYQAALGEEMEIIVKIDSDGQMDPSLIPHFVEPIARGKADYTKGNRFFDLERLGNPPAKAVRSEVEFSH